MSGRELYAFYARLGDKKIGNYFPRTTDMKYIFVVGNKCGANNVLIVSGGRYVNTSIEYVYRIKLDNETEIDFVRRNIYDYARSYYRANPTGTTLEKTLYNKKPYNKENNSAGKIFDEELVVGTSTGYAFILGSTHAKKKEAAAEIIIAIIDSSKTEAEILEKINAL